MFSNTKDNKYKIKWAKNNPEKVKIAGKKWRDNNKEKAKISAYNWHNSLRGRFRRYIRDSKKRKIDFDLTEEEFGSYWQKSCYYCGDEISTIGLDRINSDIGYQIDNVVPCCSTCNYMKLAMSKDDFIRQCRKIINKQP